MFPWRMISGSVAIGLVVTTMLACSSSESGRDPDPDAGGPVDDFPAPNNDKVGCAQDAYTEALPTQAAITATFSTENASSYLLAAIEARYPFGKVLVDGGLAHPREEGSCVEHYLTDRESAGAVLRSAPTVVHECGHYYDLGEPHDVGESIYVIRDDLRFLCAGGDTTVRAGKTFARSKLRGDAYFAKRKPCVGQSARDCDFYADLYLSGEADDDVFQGSDQGYNMLLEEAVQYVNSLATALAFEDSYASSMRAGHRDGILTFLWYVERYLVLAKTEYPDAYEAISSDPCWRQATLTVWDRAWFYLKATESKKPLGLDSDALLELVRAPELVAEIDALRRLECK